MATYNYKLKYVPDGPELKFGKVTEFPAMPYTNIEKTIKAIIRWHDQPKELASNWTRLTNVINGSIVRKTTIVDSYINIVVSTRTMASLYEVGGVGRVKELVKQVMPAIFEQMPEHVERDGSYRLFNFVVSCPTDPTLSFLVYSVAMQSLDQLELVGQIVVYSLVSTICQITQDVLLGTADILGIGDGYV